MSTCGSRYQQSAQNLLHYLALRNSDLREIQGGLASLGLSSLGRTEAHTMASICAVLRVLRGMAQGQPPAQQQQGAAGGSRAYDFREGTQQLQSNTETLLGRKPRGRNARIMVTMPAEVSADVHASMTKRQRQDDSFLHRRLGLSWVLCDEHLPVAIRKQAQDSEIAFNMHVIFKSPASSLSLRLR